MFPITLCVRDRRCLVVGGGGVALRKTQALVAEGGLVTVIAPELVEPLEELARQGQIELQRRRYRAGEAADYRLVFAATDDTEVNGTVFSDAEGAGVWVNVADDPELCSFHLPARVRRNSLEVAIASGGEAPFAVRRLRQLLEKRLGPEWGEWVSAAARFRQMTREARVDREVQEECFDRFFAETVDAEALAARVPTQAEESVWIEQANAGASDPAATDKSRVVERISSVVDRPGRVSLVGAGPGCAGLLTLRGLQLMLEADAVVYDRLAATALPWNLPARVELHCVGKTAGHHPVPQEEITAQLVRLAREGKQVVRLKGGDPYVFGRGGEEAEQLAAEGIPFQVVPGVTSGIAAPSWMGIPVTNRAEAVRVTLLTAHESIKKDGPQLRWDLLAQDPHATLVGYMGFSSLKRVTAELLAAAMDPQTPAAMVQNGTLASQRCVVSTLAELPAAVLREGLEPPALFIVGPTVRLAERLDWFGQQPLSGQRLLLPAAAVELARELEAAGAEIVRAPTPMTPAARIVAAAAPLTGCVVRSPAEVDALDDERESPGWRGETIVWCLDQVTAERARDSGWRPVRTVAEFLAPADLIAAIKELG